MTAVSCLAASMGARRALGRITVPSRSHKRN
jgi:hypothetical protein